MYRFFLKYLSKKINYAYSTFSSGFKIDLNDHATFKTKIPRYNNKTFTTKELRKQIMESPKLKNLFNKNKNVSKSYINQKNNIIRI